MSTIPAIADLQHLFFNASILTMSHHSMHSRFMWDQWLSMRPLYGHHTLYTVAYLPLGQIGHGPPLAKKFFFFYIVKKLENLVRPPLCVSTSGQRTFGPPFWNPKYATDCAIHNTNWRCATSIHQTFTWSIRCLLCRAFKYPWSPNTWAPMIIGWPIMCYKIIHGHIALNFDDFFLIFF